MDSTGKLTMEGEVANVAAKRLALGRASALPDVITVVDKLRVAPARPFSDEQIRRRLLDFLVDEPVFQDHELYGVAYPETLRPRGETSRRIEFAVSDGVVALRGRVPSLEHKRLAGVFAWWVPGSRDVANGLVVDPPEEDGDPEIAEGVRLALEKDPIVDAARVNVVVHGAVVHLGGAVAAAEERDAAEADAWYVFGVEDVRNDIAVTSPV
jgi:osmotically-inducible protein OsmY